MTELIKSGAGRFTGNDYQLWLGVKLICEWIKNSPKDHQLNPPWLSEEIGVKKYGIFDDILLYKDNLFYFFQAKYVISILGEYIDEEKLLNDKYELSLKEMYESYKKIKYELGHDNFELIICSNRPIANLLKKVLIKNNGHFEKPFISGTSRKKYKKELREKFLKKIEVNEFKSFMSKLKFQFYESPENELKNMSGFPEGFINKIYQLVKSNAIKKGDKTFSKILYELVYNIFNNENISKKNPLRIGIYSKMATPKGIEFFKSLDLYSIANTSLNKIDWIELLSKIINLKKEIEDESDKRYLELYIKSHLTIGFMIGFIFRRTTEFFLAIKQEDEIWELDYTKESQFIKKKDKKLKVKTKKINKKSQIIIFRLNFTGKNIKTAFQNYLLSNKISPKIIIDISHKGFINENAINSIVFSILALMKGHLNKPIKEIHIFNAIPIGLAVFLGYNFNAFPPIHLYEYDNNKNKYIYTNVLK